MFENYLFLCLSFLYLLLIETGFKILYFKTVELTSRSLLVSLKFASSFGWLYSVSIADKIVGVQKCIELAKT